MVSPGSVNIEYINDSQRSSILSQLGLKGDPVITMCPQELFDDPPSSDKKYSRIKYSDSTELLNNCMWKSEDNRKAAAAKEDISGMRMNANTFERYDFNEDLLKQ